LSGVRFFAKDDPAHNNPHIFIFPLPEFILMENRIFKRWAFFSVLNLLILSLVGIILRYKIILPLPFVNQKNLLHAHSHFAFSGWVSMALFTGIVWVLSKHASLDLKKYERLFLLGQIASFGMLFTFPFFGYKLPSILFSTVSVIFSYLFIYSAWKDMGKSVLPLPVANWFKAAFIFLIFSSFGTFLLAYLMSSGIHDQEWYIGSVYFFLHFQYNGWFLFSILGFFVYFLSGLTYQPGCYPSPWIFRLFVVSAIPAYFLSALWMNLPAWMYWLAVIAGIVQVIGLVYLIRLFVKCKNGIQAGLPLVVKWIWGFAFLALILKITMQAFSVIPSISHFAFGFRPIVIGYLHLVLLGLVTFFLLGFLVQQKLLDISSPIAKRGFVFFVTGVILNETLLMIQGVWSIWYETVPYTSQALFGMAVVMFLGLLQILSAQKFNRP
jgi:hypothetical protein